MRTGRTERYSCKKNSTIQSDQSVYRWYVHQWWVMGKTSRTKILIFHFQNDRCGQLVMSLKRALRLSEASLLSFVV